MNDSTLKQPTVVRIWRGRTPRHRADEYEAYNKVARIGVLAPGCPPPSTALDTLLQGLREFGYIEGQNLQIEWHYAEGRAERFPELAAELAQRPVDLIVAVSTPAVLAAKQATQTIPTMSEFGVFAREGGLMAYGPPLTDTFQRGAYYVDKLLNAGKPTELPVEQPMNFELVLNHKTAETLGLTMPPALLLQAVRGESEQDNWCARLW